MIASDKVFDLLIVGGGINGAGIARDAAGRGLKVLLVEQDDLAAHTSSASTKLIHGGLRYLEQGELRLVRESLIERGRLLGIAPHIIAPLEFVALQSGAPRPQWLVRLALLIYDRLGGRERLPRSRTIALADPPFAAGLRDPGGKAFAYFDCRVADSRLVVLNALDAAERGAEVRTRTRFVRAERRDGQWLATLSDRAGEERVRAKVLINAAGPRVAQLFERLDGVRPGRAVRLVKGSHLVLPRLYPGEHAFVIQNPDRRVVFAIPFERDFTLVGTTEAEWHGPPANPTIDQHEIRYLLDTVTRTFTRPVGASDIRWTYAGIRPLIEDGSKSLSRVTRDYVLDLDHGPSNPRSNRSSGGALLSVFGGKLTTYRRLAERAMQRLAPLFPGLPGPWTGARALPGGDFSGTLADYGARLLELFPDLPALLLERLAASYGSRTELMLGDARIMADLGEIFGSDLTQREVDYLVANEWARSAEDILFRRSKLGLHVADGTAQRLDAYVRSRLAAGDAS
ncbi:MAG: glycerol-3-phosphate dehydrogenase [Sphingomicrobium sp.]